MNQNRRAVTVGIFVFLGLIIFIVGVLTLGGQKKTFEKKRDMYTMKMPPEVVNDAKVVIWNVEYDNQGNEIKKE